MLHQSRYQPFFVLVSSPTGELLENPLQFVENCSLLCVNKNVGKDWDVLENVKGSVESYMVV